MSCRDLELELAGYLEGSLSGEAIARVEQHLDGCAECRSALAMWHKMDAWPDEEPDPGLSFRFRQELARQTRPRGWSAPRPWMAAAAALVIGVVGFVAGRATNPVTGPVAPPAGGDMATLRQEVRNLREVVALSLLEQQSASERLRGIRYSAALERPDDEVIGALTRTLRTDSSVDVRLAAADALRKFARKDAVRDAAVELLHQDDSPLVQVAVIDLLLASKDKASQERVKAMREDPKLDPSVKAYVDRALAAGPQKESQWQ